MQIQTGEIQPEIGSDIFAVKAVKLWNRLPEAPMPSPALEVFRTCLEKALSKLV